MQEIKDLASMTELVKYNIEIMLNLYLYIFKLILDQLL